MLYKLRPVCDVNFYNLSRIIWFENIQTIKSIVILMCFWVHDKSVLFSHLCKTIFTVQYIVYGIFLDISQIITTHYTTLLSCHQKKMLKIEHLLHTKLLFEISNLLYLTHSSYFFLNVFSHFGAWFPKESPWRHKKALKVHHNIVNIFKINSCILYLRGFRTNKIAIASVTIIFSFFCFFCQLVAVEHSLLQIFNFRLDVVHILM